MPATPDDLFAFLDSLGIAHKTVTHPPLFTVEQSQALRGTIPGGHTKNLFLKDKKDAVFLVVAPEEARVDLKTLHHKLGAEPLLVRLGRRCCENCSAFRPARSRRSAPSTTQAARVNVVLDAGLMRARDRSTAIRWSTP